ncbi:putative bifunctional diguanylate cyclase/phosphodiesterase [Longimicrobium sp.]|uniref:putative bifunctional diguanylate cyclase/phosphodiesterase n=1 Tax=Longimicrobium sp. TaxID=2029185 RepID=UPI002CA1D342|nr:EAL domain-containing protein [Longimicrobium sp.]HSU15275.1 EAL domain-containing protein [Longimicrobium sp.]
MSPDAPHVSEAVEGVLECAPVGIAACDADLRWVAWNAAMEALTGLPAPRVLGAPVGAAGCGLAGESPQAVLRAVLGGITVDVGDVAPEAARGRRVSVRWSPHRAPDGEILGAVAVAHDVTELRRAEDEALRLAAIPREAPNPVLECDRDGNVVYANPATRHVLAEVGTPLEDGFLPRNHRQLVAAALAHGQPMRTVEVDVDDRVFSWTYHPHVEMGVVHLFADDITARRAVEDQLRHDALHDALTALPNRHLFMERLARAVLQEKRREGYLFAVLFLDLDRFKVVNDSLGHAVGDELLVAVAGRLRNAVRETDTVSRFGGDEFAVLLDDLGAVEDALRAADRIQAALTAPVSLSGYEVFTSASIGIALSSTAYGRPDHLMRNADMAMYRAKSAGTGRHELFDRAMHALALTRLQMETDLRKAIEREEFCLHYQPIVSLRTGRIAGVEALLRWNHPERGWIAPLDFVPPAEETGLILQIGRRVIRDACLQLRDWQAATPAAAGLSVSVNLSVRQFSQADLVEQVREALAESGIRPELLRLEVTESVVVDNVDAAAGTLSRLKALGARVYLDDFGTGYSSLSSLHRLPIDALKVDRSFVARIGQGGGEQMVRTVATIARNLDLAVVAEGIETEEQLRLIRALGCEYAQGYLFSTPLDPDALRELVETAPRW